MNLEELDLEILLSVFSHFIFVMLQESLPRLIVEIHNGTSNALPSVV